VFERFTAEARRVVARAQDEARSLGHNYVGTEHLLLGLFGEDTLASRRSSRSA
jgi:ATP-dependent Clp protease ATP-binding subunit ClpA